ncbi:TonB-dependent siderophore receptor [Vibrio sp. SCSIO 43136]|uniref:TonB-dependent siderophore receptor n=1 Tax=Vibrio sp. SCSIO 43136 TaxID=2819101 RepID=UPI002074F7EC|nr:TonB-dependent siderophore receptor [Vibrio sp. SCSIO 43136]
MAISPFYLQAEVDSESQAQDSDYFENVVVWGARVSSSSESLVAEDMSLKQADHLSDLLRDVPGVDVGGTHSVNQRINIRGLSETDLDIRLDGASQHANMFHHIGNLTLNPDIIKSADIQVGNNSVTTSGLGGAVYFETKDAKDLLRPGEDFGARVFAGYGNNANQQGSVTLYGLLSDNADAMVYAYGVSRDDWKDGEGNKTFGVKGKTYNLLAKIGYDLDDYQRIQFSYDKYKDDGDYNPRPDMSGEANNGLSNDKLIPTIYDRDTLTLAYKLDGKAHNGNVTVYQSKTELERDESVMAGAWPGNRVSLNTAKNTNTGLGVKFQSDLDLAGKPSQITYGTDIKQQKSESNYGGTPFASESAVGSAIFAENKLWFNSDFSLLAGLRYDNHKRNAETGDNSYNDVTWSLGADWQLHEDLAIFANTRTLFKAPELLETFVAYQNVAYLKEGTVAETGHNHQIGLRFNKELGEHYVGTNLTVFQTRINDYIAEAYQRSSATYLIYNYGDIEIKGFELAANYSYDMFQAKASYAKSDMKDLETGDPVPAATGRSADIGDSIAVTLDYQSLDLETIFGWTSIVVLDEDNVFEGNPIKEGYKVHNLYAQWVPSNVDGLSLTFGVDNVFNEKYVSHASRSGSGRGVAFDDYEPGRNVKVSASYQF